MDPLRAARCFRAIRRKFRRPPATAVQASAIADTASQFTLMNMNIPRLQVLDGGASRTHCAGGCAVNAGERYAQRAEILYGSARHSTSSPRTSAAGNLGDPPEFCQGRSQSPYPIALRTSRRFSAAAWQACLANVEVCDRGLHRGPRGRRATVGLPGLACFGRRRSLPQRPCAPSIGWRSSLLCCWSSRCWPLI